MKIATVIARVLLGLIFVVFGLNAFLHFLPMPPMSGPAGQFMGAMVVTGYYSIIALLQIVGGVLLLSGRYVTFGLTLLVPVIVNILMFHLFMSHAGAGLAVIVTILALYLLWNYRRNFTCLLQK